MWYVAEQLPRSSTTWPWNEIRALIYIYITSHHKVPSMTRQWVHISQHALLLVKCIWLSVSWLTAGQWSEIRRLWVSVGNCSPPPGKTWRRCTACHRSSPRWRGRGRSASARRCPALYPSPTLCRSSHNLYTHRHTHTHTHTISLQTCGINVPLRDLKKFMSCK